MKQRFSMQGCLGLFLGILFCLHPPTALAHVGWGIQVTPKGEILFTDVVQQTIWKYTPEGKLTALLTDTWAHSIQLGSNGDLYFGREEVRAPLVGHHTFRVLTAGGVEKDIIAPVLNRDWSLGENAVMGPEGVVYFLGRGGVMKRTPDGGYSLLVEKSNDAMATLLLGRDDHLYVTERDRVCRISLEGVKTTLTSDLTSKDHDDPIFGKGEFNHVLGFDVGKDGIYVAYHGNRRLLKIDPNGTKSEIYHAEKPWTPAGVTIHGETIYLLETAYTDELGHFGPRVRKQLPDGRFETLVTIEK